MPLTPQQCLDDARAKLHLFQTGRLSVEVQVDGRLVKYNRTNIDQLESYIADLESQLSGQYPRFGAIGFLL